MNIDAIRQIPLVDFLNHLGYQPTRTRQQGPVVLLPVPQ